MPKIIEYPDELTHYGRLGMKWGQHIFTDKETSRSDKAHSNSGINRPVKRVTNISGDSKQIYKREKVGNTKGFFSSLLGNTQYNSSAFNLLKEQTFLGSDVSRMFVEENVSEDIKDLIDKLFDGWDEKEIAKFKRKFEKATGIPFDYVIDSYAILETYKRAPKWFGQNTGKGKGHIIWTKEIKESMLNDATYVRLSLASFLDSYNKKSGG